jgi:hypothetical protein
MKPGNTSSDNGRECYAIGLLPDRKVPVHALFIQDSMRMQVYKINGKMNDMPCKSMKSVAWRLAENSLLKRDFDIDQGQVRNKCPDRRGMAAGPGANGCRVVAGPEGYCRGTVVVQH